MHHLALIGTFDPEPLAGVLAANAHLWHDITARQDFDGSPHRDTQTIFLRWCQHFTVASALADNETLEMPPLGFLTEGQSLIAWALRVLSPERMGRAMIVALKPGGSIDLHADDGAYADAYERFHLVISSEPGNLFHVATEQVWMRPGEMWWFDHKRPHRATNDSNAWRIHLILDAAVPAYRRERAPHLDNSATSGV